MRILGLYDPEHVGMFEYHGPQRSYNREQVGGINLQVSQPEQKQQTSLYNISGRYNTVKSELASAYVRDVFAREAHGENVSGEKSQSLVDTIKEMFKTFFPGKSFLGVRPTKNGELTFDVQTAAGTHDLNELSSGEKEMIYGYLRIKNEAPKNSIIMMDEPELHLNPRLTEGLPDFYHRHIGKSLNNQLWLVTHSDSILRQSVSHHDFSVYHMQPAGYFNGIDQAIKIEADDELEQAVIQLVGDLPTYTPTAKTIFVEGGGNTEFDASLIKDLFPDISKRLNIISAGNKRKVRLIHGIMEKMAQSGRFPISNRYFSITDRDDDGDIELVESQSFRWDRYHIENYLLESSFIRAAMVDIKIQGSANLSDNDIEAMLSQCARETLPSLIKHEVSLTVRRRLADITKIRLAGDDRAEASVMHNRVAEAERLLRQSVENELSEHSLHEMIKKIQAEKSSAIDNGAWKIDFRGRDVLNRFVSDHVKVMKYEYFRNLIIAKMQAARFEPHGMKEILLKIA